MEEGMELKEVEEKIGETRESYKIKLDRFRRVEKEGEVKELEGRKGEVEKRRKDNIQPREAVSTPTKPVPTLRRTEGGTGLGSNPKFPKTRKQMGPVSHDIRKYLKSQCQNSFTRSIRADASVLTDQNNKNSV